MTVRTATRAALGGAAVFSEAEAVALLPCRDADARSWLRERGLVRTTALGRVVVWAEVVEALAAPAEEERPRRTSGLPRAVVKRNP